MKSKVSVVITSADVLVLTACTNKQNSDKAALQETITTENPTINETSEEVLKTTSSKTESESANNKEHFPQEMRYIETSELVHDMGIGINLGNTFESCGDWITGNSVQDYETAWGSPVITKKMIEGYAAEGFKCLRIPVVWSNMMASDYTIHPDYMARIKEITEWTIESGMYAIINIHWDGGWWDKFPAQKEKCMEKYMKMIYDTFVSKGVPVIIGEFGVVMDNKEKANATLFLKTVAQKAYDYDMCPVLWDTANNFSFYNRYTCSMSGFPELKEALNNIVK